MTRKKKEEPKRSWNGDLIREPDHFMSRGIHTVSGTAQPAAAAKKPPTVLTRSIQLLPEGYVFPVASRKSSEAPPEQVQ